MSLETFSGLLLYAFATSASPGPNIVLVTASGAKFGVRATLSHMYGIAAGFTFLLAIVGAGVGGILLGLPWLSDVMRALAAGYLVYLGLSIATSVGLAENGRGRGGPLSFNQAVLFQWVNPKAWAVAFGAMAGFQDPAMPFRDAVLIALTFGVISVPISLLWASGGVVMRRLFQGRALNVVLGLLVFTAVAILLS